MEWTPGVGVKRFAEVAPVAYGALMLAYLLACLEVIDPLVADALHWPSTAAKLATVVAVPVALWRVGQAVEHEPAHRHLWWKLGLVWALLGTVIVLAVVPFGEQIARASAKPTAVRVWPGTEMAAERDLLVAADQAYNLTRVVVTELLAVMVLALVASLCVRAANRIDAAMIAVLPVAVFITLLLYVMASPGAFIWDYDSFIGDVVLAGVLGELIFFMGAFDPVGAIALVVGASTVAVTARVLERRHPTIDVDAEVTVAA